MQRQNYMITAEEVAESMGISLDMLTNCFAN